MEKSIVLLLEKLVAFASVADQKDTCAHMIDFVQEYLGNAVITKRIVSDGTTNLLVYAKNHDAKQPFRILLNAHLDVVPAPAAMFTMTIAGDEIKGRGVYDMKAAGAVMIQLLVDLSQNGILPHDVGLVLVTDEEIGGFHGTKAVMDSGLADTKFFLGGEPTDFKILYAHKGLVRVAVTYQGKPAHGSRPWEGDNAAVKLAVGVAKFYQDHPLPAQEAWQTTYSLNLLNGGTASNIVPDQAEAVFDIRRIEEDAEATVVATVARYFPGAAISTMSGPGLLTDRNAAEIKQLANIIQNHTGEKAVFLREHYSTDARFYSPQGVPAIHFGPVGGGIHQRNEWVSIKSLVSYYEMLKEFIMLK